MKNVEALKKLYAAISGGETGAVEDDNTIAEVIDHLADLMSTAVEHFAPFVITITPTSSTAGESDVTAGEIIEAVTEGRSLVVMTSLSGIDYQMNPVAVSIDDADIAINAIGIQEPEGILLDLLLPYSRGTANSWEMHSYVLTPVE